MAQLLTTGNKNALWAAYRDAKPLVRAEISLELKKAGLDRHWRETASKAGYDLKKAKAPLRDIFTKLMPETAPMFGLPGTGKKRTKPTPEDGTLSLFK